MADALASTLACASANALVNYSMYVPQRPSKVPIAPMGKLLTRLPRLSLAQLRTLHERFGELQQVRAAETSKKFPSPRWENADELAFSLACATVTDASVNFSRYVPQRPSKVPIAPMGKCLAPMGISHVLHLCLQGGGVFISSGTVSFSSCTITGNTATSVRAHPQKFPSPRWEKC